MLRKIVLIAFAVIALASAQQQQQRRGVPSDWQAVMNRIRPESVRAHLSFLASDVLEGRGTPSRGLDVAAEYIASQFRRAGLEPISGNSYFQPLSLREAALDLAGFECRIFDRGEQITVAGIPVSGDAIQLDREPLLPISSPTTALKDAVLVFRDDNSDPRGLLKKLSENGAKLVIVVDPTGRLARGATRIRLTAPNEDPKLPSGRWLFVPSFPETLSPEARITVKAKPLSVRALRASNVAGILRGDDPKLRETYVVVSAHYDHEGTLPFGPGDRVFNGANDDASGVTGVLEIAAAIAAMPERPKRSIIFATFAGEEEGLLGSREFVRHRPVPLEKIVANLNFEHLGRPDADGTSYVGKAAATGFDFSTLGATLAEAGLAAGVDIFKHEKFSDPFFTASDNYSFAVAGIPSLTVCHGFIFPEYHALGDHWEKINVESMTQVLRALAMGALKIADDSVAPQWNETNEKAAKFRQSSRR